MPIAVNSLEHHLFSFSYFFRITAAATKDVKPTKPGDRAANKMDDKVGSGNNVNDMSAYYSEDDQDMSDDDFQPNKRKKVGVAFEHKTFLHLVCRETFKIFLEN